MPTNPSIPSIQKQTKELLAITTHPEFIKAIDATAMAIGAKDSDAYLAEWRRGEPEACSGNLAAEADAAVASMLAAYDMDRLKRLISNGGKA